MRAIRLLYLLLTFMLLGSCGRVRQFLPFTPYTHDRPDTIENKKGFERHFGVSPSPDVTELYFYADELGIDAKYQLGFKADRSTVDKIIAKLGLEQMDQSFDDQIATEFPWWQKSDLAGLKPYHVQIAKVHKYLWYDEKKRQVWYLDFDL